MATLAELPPAVQSTINTILSLPIHQYLSLNFHSVTHPSSVPAKSVISTSKIFFPLSTHVINPAGSLHGGVSAFTLDVACFICVLPTLAPDEGAVTIASSCQFIGTVSELGKVVEIEGRLVKRTKDLAFCEGVLMCKGTILAKGSFTKKIVKKPKKKDEKL
jgi:acyl-coenzyme A thioesterase PaaI-like protein